MEDEADIPPEKPLPEELPAMSSSDYHQFAQKQILNTVFSALSESKMEWPTILPFLEAAREVCAGDVQDNARFRLHTSRADGDEWVEAEEAFLGISVADRDDGLEWLSETWWLSEIATADNDRAEVEAIIAGLERTIAKLRSWLENGGDVVQKRLPRKRITDPRPYPGFRPTPHHHAVAVHREVLRRVVRNAGPPINGPAPRSSAMGSRLRCRRRSRLRCRRRPPVGAFQAASAVRTPGS